MADIEGRVAGALLCCFSTSIFRFFGLGLTGLSSGKPLPKGDAIAAAGAGAGAGERGVACTTVGSSTFLLDFNRFLLFRCDEILKKHVIMSITLIPYRFAPFIFKLSSSESSNITKSAFFDALRFCLLVFFFCLVGAGLFSESFG